MEEQKSADELTARYKALSEEQRELRSRLSEIMWDKKEIRYDLPSPKKVAPRKQLMMELKAHYIMIPWPTFFRGFTAIAEPKRTLKDIAAEMGVSPSAVQQAVQKMYQYLLDAKNKLDKETE